MTGLSVTIIIIAITCIISYRAFQDQATFKRLMHHPVSEHKHKEYYRLLTSGFIHGSFMHLLINMYVLYEFGSIVEQVFVQNHGPLIGRSAYVIMYLTTIVAASIPTHLKHKDNPYYSAIGASGGVSGILFSFIVFFPWMWLGIMFIIPCPAIVFAVLYLFYSSWASKNSNDHIGHDAHFYGALFGLLFTFAMDPGQVMLFVERVMDFRGPSF